MSKIKKDKDGFIYVNGVKFCRVVGVREIEIPYRKRRTREETGQAGAVIDILDLVQVISAPPIAT